jgi:hypothetical protein
MFMATIGLAFSTLLTFGEIRSGSGFEDVGDTYGPIGGGYEDVSGQSGQGVKYTTEDAVPPANTHDL